jgi:hypothetical protein
MNLKTERVRILAEGTVVVVKAIDKAASSNECFLG